MGCHHYDVDDLDCLPDSKLARHRHAADLVEREHTTLTVDGAHAGVGGIDSWGSLPLPEHRLSGDRTYEWAFAMQPFGEGDPSPDVLGDALRALSAIA